MSAAHHFVSLDDAYRWVIDAVLSDGERVAPRSLSTMELRAVCLTISDPRQRYVSLRPRRWSFAYALGELCWHLRGSNRLEEIAFYSKRWREMSDDGLTISGSCYGATIFGKEGHSASQWEIARRSLQLDAASRRAILEFSDGRRSGISTSRDVNCATTLQFMVRDGRLEAIATMRSNDVILGLPYDIFLFSMLQELMAVELGLEVGGYHHFVGSLHIYDRDLAWAREIASSRPSIMEAMPRMPGSSGVTGLLKGEQLTRGRAVLEIGREAGDSYWIALLDVLRYCNGVRRLDQRAALTAVHSPLYRRLVELRGDPRNVDDGPAASRSQVAV